MSEEKCFCHLNGFEVKDAKARKSISQLSSSMNLLNTKVNDVYDILGAFQEDIANCPLVMITTAEFVGKDMSTIRSLYEAGGNVDAMNVDYFNRTPKTGEKFLGIGTSNDKFVFTFIGQITGVNASNNAEFKMNELIVIHNPNGEVSTGGTSDSKIYLHKYVHEYGILLTFYSPRAEKYTSATELVDDFCMGTVYRMYEQSVGLVTSMTCGVTGDVEIFNCYSCDNESPTWYMSDVDVFQGFTVEEIKEVRGI